MRTDIGFTHLDITPGVPVRVAIDVTNTSDVIDGITVIVDGLDPSYVKLEDPLVRLFPDESGEVAFEILVPPSCPAGDYLIVARLVSTISAERQVAHDFWVSVAPRVAAEMDLVPQVITKRSKAELSARITNLGNTESTFNITAVDPNRDVACRVEPPDLIVPIGAVGEAVVRMKGPRPWFGSPETRSIAVTATNDEVELQTIATFNQKPRLPRGLVTFLMLAGIITLWALIFILVINAIRSQDSPGKALASTFVEGGDPSLPIASIGSTAAGTVTSATDGAGIPRIAVLAYRTSADGDVKLMGEGATDDDGSFSVASLLPGSYRLKFVGPGFGETWFPGTDEAGAEAVDLEPAGGRDDLDIVLAGGPGGFIGSIEVPASSGPPPTFVITATRLVEPDPDADPESLPPPEQYTVETQNEFQLAGLPAPADYRIRVAPTGGQYAAQEFEESLAAGETKVLNPIVPGASAGRLAGQVVDGAGNPLGGVTVTVSNGGFSTEVVTPTSGAVGSFQVVGLPTPETYIVTFSLEGYSGETQALDLGPGASNESVNARLVGGQGTLTGSVVRAGELPGTTAGALGAVEVLVQGNGFEAKSKTLTTAGDTGGVGSYLISAIPVGGRYTVTFTAQGFARETLQVTFDQAGSQALPVVALTPTSGRVFGIVTDDRLANLGEVAITINDGANVRSTASSTDPIGRYSFAKVLPGSYMVKFSKPGYESFVKLITVSANQQVDASVRLKLITGRASGTVRSLSGTPLSGVSVTVEGGATPQVATTSASGLFSFATLDPGTYRFQYAAAGYLPAELTIIVRAGEPTDASISLSPVPATTTTTTIAPVPSFTVLQSVDPLLYDFAGQTLTFTITVANTGNVGLTGVAVSNSLVQSTVPISAVLTGGDLDADLVLDVGETWVYTATYTTTVADTFSFATVTNTASVVSVQATTPVAATATSEFSNA